MMLKDLIRRQSVEEKMKNQKKIKKKKEGRRLNKVKPKSPNEYSLKSAL